MINYLSRYTVAAATTLILLAAPAHAQLVTCDDFLARDESAQTFYVTGMAEAFAAASALVDAGVERNDSIAQSTNWDYQKKGMLGMRIVASWLREYTSRGEKIEPSAFVERVSRLCRRVPNRDTSVLLLYDDIVSEIDRQRP